MITTATATVRDHTDTSSEALAARQADAARVLGQLLAKGGPRLHWHLPAGAHDCGTLLGIRDEGLLSDRIDRVDAWAALLGVTPTWRPLHTGGGEYRADGAVDGVPVAVHAFLPYEPVVIETVGEF